MKFEIILEDSLTNQSMVYGIISEHKGASPFLFRLYLQQDNAKKRLDELKKQKNDIKYLIMEFELDRKNKEAQTLIYKPRRNKMKFEPFKIEDEKPLMEGIASFEILSNKDGISKAGNEKMVVRLKVWDACGTEGLVYDHIPATFEWKIKHLLCAVKKEEYSEKGEVPEDGLVGLSGKLILKKDESPLYGITMKVLDYRAPVEKETLPFDDDIPFG